jgi:peroxiredoxin-like protein
MKPLPHVYDVFLSAGRTGYAIATAPNLPDLRTAPPPDYDGPGDAWSPEHLLLASVETCFVFTMRAVARMQRIDVIGLELDSRGTVDRKDGVTRFTEIVLRPTLTVAPGTDRERALKLIEQSERACLVSSSLSTPIRLEPTIIEHQAASV